MVKSRTIWTFGRGVLGPLKPLIGDWRFSGQSKLGATKCKRTFEPILAGKYVQLRAEWRTPSKLYEEIALFGAGPDKQLQFWSFTSDGGHSVGERTEATDIHERALCFEAEMPAGRARMLYWPHEREGFWFAVESRSKKGWSRFLEQHFTLATR